MLKIKLLSPLAHVPTVAHPGEDLGFDLYAIEGWQILAGGSSVVKTGVAIEFAPAMGGLIRERSSMAKNRIVCTGGVIDAGYRGEIVVRLENLGTDTYCVNVGDRIAQLIPMPVHTSMLLEVVQELSPSKRLGAGFGSSGK